MINKISKLGFQQREKESASLFLYREKIFFLIFITSIIGALLPYYMNLKISLSEGSYLNAAIYTLAYLIALAVTFITKIPFSVRAWTGLLLFYFMGLVGLVSYGPEASGRLWLFMFAILTTLILSLRAGIVALVINTATILLWMWGWSESYFPWVNFSNTSAEVIYPTVSSFLFMTVLVSVSLGLFLNYLDRALRRERELSAQLRQSNERLEEEGEKLRASQVAYRESEELFSLFAQQLPGMVFIKDHQGRYLYFNNNSLDFFGFNFKDVIGKQAEEIHPPERAKLYRETDRVLLETGQPISSTEETKYPDGKRAVMLNHKFLIQRENKPPLIAGIYLDMTKRTEAEEAIKNSEAKFRLVVERASEGIIVIQDNRYKFVNDYMLDIFKMSRREVLSSELMSMVHPEDRQQLLDRVRRRMAGESVPDVLEHRIIDGEGNIRWLETRGVISDWEGRPASIAFATDITDRREYEVFIKQSEDRFRTLVGMAPEPIFVHRDGEIIYANQAFLASLGGRDLADLEGKKVWDFVAPEERQAARERTFQQQEGGTAPLKEFNMTTLDGRHLVLEATGRGILFDSKPAVITMWRDISDRIMAQKELQISEERYRISVELFPDPIFVHRQGKIFFANQAAVNILGLGSMDDLIGKYIWEFNTSQDQIELAQKRAIKMESGGPIAWQRYEVIRSDGKKVTIEALGKSLSFPGYKAIMTVWRDLTERLRAEKEKGELEAQLSQVQKMEALGTLAGGIAHDFNNILAAIMGYSELAMDRAEAGQPSPEELKHIFASAERAKDLVTQILTFSRKVESELKPIDLNGVVYQTEQMLERTIPRMVQIEHRLTKDLWPVNADPGQMTQVLMNLGVNASDAMPDGGKLTIEAENVTLDQAYSNQHVEVSPGDYVRLTVSDTGSGMDQETLEHIFDPFFTKKEVGKGTGLGLATVYGIVKNHKGHIICQTELGRGTTFTVYLPALSGEVGGAPDQQEAEGAEIEGGTETILLVDDEETIRDLGQQILARQGYRVITAINGEEALEIYGRSGGDIDLVILDINMPGMGGQKCLQELLGIDPRVKVIVSSGYSLSGQPGDIIDQEASGFVPKPFKKSDMITMVRKVLDG